MCTKRAEAFFPLFDCSLPLAADRAGKPPSLSSLADKSVSTRSPAAPAAREQLTKSIVAVTRQPIEAPNVCRERSRRTASP
jgi:hypothetical protein